MKEHQLAITAGQYEKLLAQYPFLKSILRISSREDMTMFVDNTAMPCPENVRANTPERIDSFDLIHSQTHQLVTTEVSTDESADDERVVSVKRMAKESGIAPDYVVFISMPEDAVLDAQQFTLYRIPAGWIEGSA